MNDHCAASIPANAEIAIYSSPLYFRAMREFHNNFNNIDNIIRDVDEINNKTMVINL